MLDINADSRDQESNLRPDDQDGAPAAEQDEARQFYESLEETGQLVDVKADTDLATLPPSVTHIRRPDGTVERIGFSSSP